MKNFLSTKTILSIALFVLIFCILGLPFTQWGFLHDDFGVILHSHITSISHIAQLFSEPGMSSVVQPDNVIMQDQSFFATLYRPLSYVLYALQMKAFGFFPYGYFLVMIFFHALNSVLLFYFFTKYFSITISFLAALFFGFHISYWDWMGWVAGQMHVINFTFILIIILLVKYYIDTKKFWAYFLALFLFLISLFTRETALILPIWGILALMLYKPNKPYLWYFKKTLGFWLLDIFYLIMRMLAHPIKTSGKDIKVILNPIDFILNFKNRFFDLVTFGADISNLSWLPGGNRLLKGSLIFLFFTFLIWLFYKNTQKKVMLFCLVSMGMFMWPAILRYYSSRYLYKTLPFFIIFLIVGILYYQYKSDRSKAFCTKLFCIFFGIISCCNIILLAKHMGYRENILHKTSQALDELVQDPRIKNRALCFIALPYDIFPTGVAQALRMRNIPETQKIYYDNSTFVWSNKPINQNYVSISQNNNKLRIRSHNPSVWFNPYNKLTSMGTITSDTIDKKTGNIMTITYSFDKEWLEQNLLFITWDYEQHKFVILNPFGDSMKKILVTGGAGFLGSHLCERLLTAGNIVIALDNLSTGRLENIEHLLTNKNFTFIKHDITEPLDLGNNTIDWIFNFACPASPPHYQKDPVQTTKTCVLGALNMLELAKKHNARIMQASTSEVYGDPIMHPQQESYWGNVNPIGIRSCYDEGKRCAETLFFDYFRMYNLDIKVIRIFNTYGPNMDPNDGRVVSNFIMQALQNKPLTMYGDGKQTRSFCYVDDLIDGILAMMNTETGITGPVNLGNPTEFNLLELAERVLRVTQSSSKIVFKPLPKDDPTKRKPDITQAKKLLNWEPKIDLETGLVKTIKYFETFINKELSHENRHLSGRAVSCPTSSPTA